MVEEHANFLSGSLRTCTWFYIPFFKKIKGVQTCMAGKLQDLQFIPIEKCGFRDGLLQVGFIVQMPEPGK